jgi:hypothetical protein
MKVGVISVRGSIVLSMTIMLMINTSRRYIIGVFAAIVKERLIFN